jgi:hypothetical protein
MNVNFFKKECQTTTNAKRFGLFDAEDQTPALIKFNDEESWNATVINEGAIELIFTAIDNCIEILRDNGEMDNRCDAMLTSDNTLLLIELKNKRNSWQQEGLFQIESTFKRMMIENPAFYNGFKKRKAIVANAKYQFPSFQAANLEQREYFWRNYKARIQFDAGIFVK